MSNKGELRSVQQHVRNRTKIGQCLQERFRECESDEVEYVSHHLNRVSEEIDALTGIAGDPVWASDAVYAETGRDMLLTEARKLVRHAESQDRKVEKKLGPNVFYGRWQ